MEVLGVRQCRLASRTGHVLRDLRLCLCQVSESLEKGLQHPQSSKRDRYRCQESDLCQCLDIFFVERARRLANLMENVMVVPSRSCSLGDKWREVFVNEHLSAEVSFRLQCGQRTEEYKKCNPLAFYRDLCLLQNRLRYNTDVV